MGVPCTPVSTVDIAEGDGISVSFLAGVYTISVDPSVSADYDNYKVYATEAARDSDNPSPSSGDMASSIADDRLWIHDGTGWVIMAEPEQLYTPTFANATLGTSPARTGGYQRSDGFIDFWAKLTLGTGGAMTASNVTVSMPSGVTLAAKARGWGYGEANDSGTRYNTHFDGVSAAASTVNIFVTATGSTYAASASIVTAVPFTWAVGDILFVGGRAAMNTRYL